MTVLDQAPSPALASPIDGPGPHPVASSPLAGPQAMIVPALNRALKVLNRWFMVPVFFAAGSGHGSGTPYGGYMLLLRVRGRRSGLLRSVPLSYLVADGAVWVMAGFGTRTEWYRNLVADPLVEAGTPRVASCAAARSR